jgi:hypothetical protein
MTKHQENARRSALFPQPVNVQHLSRNETDAREIGAGCRYLVDASDASHRDLRPAPCAAFCRCSSWLISLGTDW